MSKQVAFPLFTCFGKLRNMAVLEAAAQLASLLEKWKKDDEEGRSPVETLKRSVASAYLNYLCQILHYENNEH